MMRVQLLGLDRPGLTAALAAQGLAIADPSEAPMLVVAADSSVMTQATCPSAPVLIVADDDARAAALLDAGVDDVVATGASDTLIAARAAALARRGAGLIRVGDITIDPTMRTVSRGDRPIVLLPQEYHLLLRLARAAGHLVPRETLLQQVWGLGFDPGTNLVAVHVSRLRARLDDGFARTAIITERGRGYRLLTDCGD